jgi:hypothetical protein
VISQFLLGGWAGLFTSSSLGAELCTIHITFLLKAVIFASIHLVVGVSKIDSLLARFGKLSSEPLMPHFTTDSYWPYPKNWLVRISQAVTKTLAHFCRAVSGEEKKCLVRLATSSSSESPPSNGAAPSSENASDSTLSVGSGPLKRKISL